MKQSEKQVLLNRYEELQDEVSHQYDIGCPAVETIQSEAKVELMKEIMTAFNIPFEE